MGALTGQVDIVESDAVARVLKYTLGAGASDLCMLVSGDCTSAVVTVVTKIDSILSCVLEKVSPHEHISRKIRQLTQWPILALQKNYRLCAFVLLSSHYHQALLGKNHFY